MFDKVIFQYVRRIERLLLRAVSQKRELTNAEQKGVAYYTSAAESLRTLGNQPEPVWVGLKFEKSRIL